MGDLDAYGRLEGVPWAADSPDKKTPTRLTENRPPKPDTASPDAARQRPVLNLFVPPQAPPAPDSLLLDAKLTAEWFESLPKANVGETARRIYGTLVDFNRMELSPALRARNAEQFREPIEYISTNLRRHYVDTGFPLRDKGQKAAALARALYQELAIAYKSIVQDLLAERGERFDGKLLVVSLHRAASYLLRALAHSALVYAPWPGSLWREIHAIYAYAWQNQIHQIQVREGEQRNSARSTLEDVYLATLLFAAASPHRLRQGQQLALLEELPNWTGHVRLGPPDEARRGPGQFQVDLFSDSPPMRGAPDAPAANRRLRNLDLQALLSHMRKLFEQTPWQGSAGSDTRGHKLSRQLLRTVIHSWSSEQERRFVRTRLNFELTVVAGLNHLHDHLIELQRAGELDQQEEESRDRYASSFLHHVDTRPVDPWSEPFSHGLGSGLRTVEAEPLPESEFRDSAPGSMLADGPPSAHTPDAGHTVRTLNESAGGYCIQWQGNDLPRVRIGEIIGIQSNSNAQDFSLATVRWMRQDPGQPLQFGVEILAPHCSAGEVTPTGESRSQYPRVPQRCLVIPAPNGASNGCIILPSALFAVGALLQLLEGGGKRRISLSQVVETTGAYARYQFEDQSGTRQEPGGGAQQESTDEFDDLWNNL